MRVEVRRGLVVCMTYDLQHDQWVSPGFIQEGHVIMTQKVQSQRGLDLFQDVTVLLGVGIVVPYRRASRVSHPHKFGNFMLLLAHAQPCLPQDQSGSFAALAHALASLWTGIESG